jgi:hypothetical protein
LVRTPIEPTYSELAHWQDTSPNVSRDDSKNNYWIATGERCMRLDEVAYQVLSTAETYSSMGEILSCFDEDLRLRLEVYFETLAQTGLLELYHLDGTVKETALSL